MKKINRRQFIFYLLGAAGAVMLSKVTMAVPFLKQQHDTNDSIPALTGDGTQTTPLKDFQPAMVIDVGGCIGCRRCMYGCKAENNQPDSISPPWIEVFQMPDEVDLTGHPSQEYLRERATINYTTAPKEGFWYLATQCNHCKNAPCVKVCPTGATYRDDDGYVLVNYDKCIGCRFCIVACPYNARRFNWVKPQLDELDINPQVPVRPVGVVEKCTFCVHRTRLGKLPRCVIVCPMHVRHFGNLLDPDSEVSKLLRDEESFRLLEELNTGPHIYYITRGKKYLR